MTELIKEVTPPKKPDFANPYEAANPMIKPAPKKQPVRRTRTATKAAEQAKNKEPELTPQAIIEATVPKVRVSASCLTEANIDVSFRGASGRDHLPNSLGSSLRRRESPPLSLLPAAARV